MKHYIEYFTNDSFYRGLYAAFLAIFSSEIGDKTFLIATIYSIRHRQFLLIFLATCSALLLMSVISAIFGLILPTIMSKSLTKIISSILLVCFGVKMILDSYRNEENSLKTEYKDIEKDIDDTKNKENDVESLQATQTRICHKNYYLFLQVFFLTFMAEMGDRSQVATIILGGSQVK
jgi:Ca2+/H+ antiporter, TMEM165/GDT1 family